MEVLLAKAAETIQSKRIYADNYTAKWVECETGHTVCSACMAVVNPEHAIHFKFCPYCGREMKKER